MLAQFASHGGADLSLARQNRRQVALQQDGGQVLLFQAARIHQEPQHVPGAGGINHKVFLFMAGHQVSRKFRKASVVLHSV